MELPFLILTNAADIGIGLPLRPSSIGLCRGCHLPLMVNMGMPGTERAYTSFWTFTCDDQQDSVVAQRSLASCEYDQMRDCWQHWTDERLC